MTIDSVAKEIRGRMRAEADPVRAERETRYFRGTIRCFGLTVPKSTAIAKDVYRERRDTLTDDEWFSLSERLLASGWFEEGNAGLRIARLLRLPSSKQLFNSYERWLGTHVGNWAHCDELCGHLIGPILADIPALVSRLLPWTKSENRWMRRGAAVSLLMPASKGLFLAEGLAVAEALLGDEDDLVRKGFGWMLREHAKQHRPEVTAFLERHVGRMPRVAFRYAIERFPPDERKRLMAL